MAGNFACLTAASLGGIDLTYWGNLLQQVWRDAADTLRWIVESLRANANVIFGLAGFSFGVWRWWYYRESVLHKRLQEYLADQDRRLHQARTYVLEAIFRPGPKRQFADPLFAVKPLRSLLRRRGWRSLFGIRTIERGANRLLSKALRSVEARLETAEATLTSFQDQRASVHILKGAIASARAADARSAVGSAQLDRQALDEFRIAVQVPGSNHRVEAKEYEAHQLRRLGHLQEASGAYEELDALAKIMLEGRSRDLTLARAKRWRAAIIQAAACEEWNRQLRVAAGSHNARRLMIEPLPVRWTPT